MKKINKKIVVYIIIISVIALIIYEVAIKKENLIENITDINTIETSEENETKEQEKVDITNKIMVYITGEVKNPGIYELEENSRIKDVIEKAGGLKETADITDINLATILQDEDKITIPTKDKTMEEKQNTERIQSNKQSKTTEKSQNTTSISTNTTGKNQNTKVNINTATQTELETLPGIGPSTASKIVSYRKENGKFKSIEEIKKVNGIGESKYKKIKELIKV